MLNVPTLSQMLGVIGVALLSTAVVVAALGALLGLVQRNATRRAEATPAEVAGNPTSVPGPRHADRQDALASR
jgi:hypothetical protein